MYEYTSDAMEQRLQYLPEIQEYQDHCCTYSAGSYRYGSIEW